jgi:hypothetical protein
MATAYSSILKLALPVQGELAETWGDVVNDNITSMIEEAIAGSVTIDVWTADAHTLTSANGTTSESRCAILELTDTTTDLSGAGDLIVPDATKIYVVNNNTGQIITVKTAAGTGVAIADAVSTIVYCDATNVLSAITASSTATTSTEGVIQLATQAQVTAGTETDLAVTPETLTGFAGSLASILTINPTYLTQTAVSLGATTTPAIDCITGNYFYITLTGNTTFSFSNVPATGTFYKCVLELTGASTYTTTYPAAVLWAGGTAPTTPGAAEIDLIELYTRDGGTTWYGVLTGDAMA